MKFEFKFEIGQEVYNLDTSGYYFYVRVGKIKSYSIYPNKILYNVDGVNIHGKYEERELLTKEELIKN